MRIAQPDELNLGKLNIKAAQTHGAADPDAGEPLDPGGAPPPHGHWSYLGLKVRGSRDRPITMLNAFGTGSHSAQGAVLLHLAVLLSGVKRSPLRSRVPAASSE